MIEPPATSRPLVDDKEQELQKLTDTDWKKLRLIANKYAFKLSIGDSSDLLQDAFTSYLSGQRIKPPGLDLVRFLRGAMRSISDNNRKSRSGEFHSGLVNLNDDATIDSCSDTLQDDEYEIARQKAAERKCDLIYEFFKEDEDVLCILMGKQDGYKKMQIMETTGLSETAYETAMKRLTRNLEKALPAVRNNP